MERYGEVRVSSLGELKPKTQAHTLNAKVLTQQLIFLIDYS